MVTPGKPRTLMAAGRLALHPVVEEVKVKLTEPVATGETTPWLETAAMLKLEDDQLPPLDGLRLIVLPIQRF